MNVNSVNRFLLWTTKKILGIIGFFSPKAKCYGNRLIFLGSVGKLLTERHPCSTDKPVGTIVIETDTPEVFSLGECLAHDIWTADNVDRFIEEAIPITCDYVSLPDQDIFVDTVVSMTPEWLQYEKKTMREDLHKLISITV